MPCTKCNADFNLLNWKLKCNECEESHCGKCLRKQEGCYFCDVCMVLTQRPPIRANLMELKPKDLQHYLNKYKIPTHGLVEKHELVDLFWLYQIPVMHKKSHRNKLLNFTGSVPNLAARSQCYLNNLKSNAEAAINNTRNFFPPTNGGFSATTSPTRSSQHQHHSPPYPNSQRETSRQNSTESVPTPSRPTPQPTAPPPPADDPPTPARRYPEISEFESEEQLSNLSVKQLKELLQLNRVNYKGCVEKSDLLHLVVMLWRDEHESRTSIETNFDNCCKICMDAPLECVLLECGHIATCIQCGKQLAECPICRQYITRVVRTFKV